MNQTLKTILIVLGVLVVAGGLFFAGTMFSQAGLFGPRTMMSGYGWDNYPGFGPGMMYGRGGNGRGPGMMGGGAGAYGMGPGMMRGYGWDDRTSANVTPLTVDQAKQAANKYVQSLNLQGLELGETMIFNNNAYVAVKETSTGLGAFELLVDPTTQIANPESRIVAMSFCEPRS